MNPRKYENSVEETSASSGTRRLACALCGSLEAQPILEKRIDGRGGRAATVAFRLWRCAACGLVRTEPQLTPHELEPYYAEEYWGGIEATDSNWIRRDQRHRTGFLRRFRSEGSVLDVGCGLGFFLRALDPKNWDRFGVEPMPVPYRQAAGSPGSERGHNGELLSAPFASSKLEGVTLWGS